MSYGDKTAFILGYEEEEMDIACLVVSAMGGIIAVCSFFAAQMVGISRRTAKILLGVAVGGAIIGAAAPIVIPH